MESIAKPIGEDVHKLRVTRLSTVAGAIRSTWVTRWYKTYLDDSSNVLKELLLDMFEWNPGLSFVTGSA